MYTGCTIKKLKQRNKTNPYTCFIYNFLWEAKLQRYAFFFSFSFFVCQEAGVIQITRWKRKCSIIVFDTPSTCVSDTMFYVAIDS